MSFNPREHLMNLKGKEYLQVMWRLVWFREEKPNWAITTELLDYDKEMKSAMFKACICDDQGAVKAMATGSESAKDFGDFIEKAETKAIGRALAILGYGTQFTATELDEDERIVDSPVAKLEKLKKNPVVHEAHKCGKCGKDIAAYRGKTADEWIKWSTATYGNELCGVCGMDMYARQKMGAGK